MAFRTGYLFMLCCAGALLLLPAFGGVTARISVSSAGVAGNHYSYDPSISANGRYVAFSSVATNLVTGDTNGVEDVFVQDRTTGITTRVSVSTAGVEGNDVSYDPAISADGRYVAFISSATNLIAGDTNGYTDIFLRDLLTGQTTRIAAGNGNSSDPSLSADDRYVVFTSAATDLVPNDVNGHDDIFVYDRNAGQMTRVSLSTAGTAGNGNSYTPSISADGRYVAFTSYASNLVANDYNGKRDVFVRDRTAGQIARVSISSSGAQGNADSYNPSISADGNSVVFVSAATTLVPGNNNSFADIFVHNRITGETTCVSVSSSGVFGNSNCYASSISSDGRYVVFQSAASNLVDNDTNGHTDIFLRDRTADLTTCASISTAGVLGNGESYDPAISANGRYIAFHSSSYNLVANDINDADDVFVHDRLGVEGNFKPDLLIRTSNDGSYVGDNICNTTGAGQTKTMNVAVNQTATFYCRVQNDGSTTTSFTVTGPAGGSGYAVGYVDYATNAVITTAVTGAGWDTGAIIPGQYKVVVIRIVPTASALPGTTKEVALLAQSPLDPLRMDLTIAKTSATFANLPDVMIRTSAESSYTGDNIYNTTAVGQVKSLSMTVGNTATYYCRIQNDGTQAAAFTITGPAGNSAYAVGYVNYATNVVITGAVTGAGWNTGSIAPSQYVVVVIRVVPTLSAIAGTTNEVKLQAQSPLDAARVDVAKALTSVYIPYLPDVQVRTSAETGYAGDNIYNTTGVGQAKAQIAAVSQTAVYYCRIQNDASVSTSYTVTGTAGDSAYAVGYVNNATSAVITNAVTGAGWNTGAIAPGQYVVVVIRVVPTVSATAGSSKDVWLQATAPQDAARTDAVKTTTSLVASYQPDVQIRTSAESSYTGDNIYNATGVGQSKAQSTAAGQTATYYCRVQNDGFAAESFTVTGLAGGSDFAVGYVDFATNNVITGAVTGAGWSTGSIAPGQYVVVVIRVVPSSGAAVGASKEVWLQAKSTLDAVKVDLVKATTTRQ